MLVYRVSTTFIASGDIAEYGRQTLAAIEQIVAEAAGVSSSRVQVSVAPASVRLTVSIAYDEHGTATAVATALSGILSSSASAVDPIFASVSALSTALVAAGVSVIEITAGPTVYVVPASQPPPTPPSPAIPSIPPPAVEGSAMEDGTLGGFIGGVVFVLAILSCLAARKRWKRRSSQIKKEEAPRLVVDVPSSTADAVPPTRSNGDSEPEHIVGSRTVQELRARFEVIDTSKPKAVNPAAVTPTINPTDELEDDFEELEAHIQDILQARLDKAQRDAETERSRANAAEEQLEHAMSLSAMTLSEVELDLSASVAAADQGGDGEMVVLSEANDKGGEEKGGVEVALVLSAPSPSKSDGLGSQEDGEEVAIVLPQWQFAPAKYAGGSGLEDGMEVAVVLSEQMSDDTDGYADGATLVLSQQVTDEADAHGDGSTLVLSDAQTGCSSSARAATPPIDGTSAYGGALLRHLPSAEARYTSAHLSRVGATGLILSSQQVEGPSDAQDPLAKRRSPRTPPSPTLLASAHSRVDMLIRSKRKIRRQQHQLSPKGEDVDALAPAAAAFESAARLPGARRRPDLLPSAPTPSEPKQPTRSTTGRAEVYHEDVAYQTMQRIRRARQQLAIADASGDADKLAI